MKYWIVLAGILVACTRTVMAAGGVTEIFHCEFILDDGRIWRYSLDNGGATILSAPESINGALEIPDKFGEYPVVGIGANSFGGRDDIVQLTMPETVERIGENAFWGCSRLKGLTVPKSASVIGQGAFAGCDSLQTLTIPFVGRTREAVDEAATLASMFGIVPSGGSRKIGPIFHNDPDWYVPTNLTTVTVTDAPTIGRAAFSRCEDLRSIVFTGGVTNVQDKAFEECSRLEMVVFPEGLVSIGAGVFSGCESLKSEVLALLPSSLTTIGIYAFACCGITEITALPPSIRDIDAGAFSRCLCVTNVVIGEAVVHIGAGAFSGCSQIESITLPFVGSKRDNSETSSAIFAYIFGSVNYEGMRKVNRLDYYDWYMPTNLTRVVVNDETVVGRYAFLGCQDIRDITFNCEITNIWLEAFKSCGQLERISFMGNEVAPTLHYATTLFVGVPSICTVMVSHESTGWGVEIPGTWNGLRIAYAEDDPIPALPADAAADAVAAALSGSWDARLAENIRNASDYAAYHGWVGGVTNAPDVDAGAVKSSPYAWLSFALGADRLIGREILPEDVRIVSFDAGSGGSKGALSFEVAIDGVEIGGGMVADETLKENLRKVLGVEGSANLSPDAFSSDNTGIEFDAPVDGKARFTVTPPADAGSVYFMRVKVK